MKTAVIFDHGFGNLHSAKKAFLAAGFDATISRDKDAAIEADLLVIPGVGAFSACVDAFKKFQGDEIVKERLRRKLPIFGICVGFQILFNCGTEGSDSTDLKTRGLALIPGSVEKLDFITSPHMGWNNAGPKNSEKSGEFFYFVHSFGVKSTQEISAWASENSAQVWMSENDGVDFVSAVFSELISGTQFHPEKSGDAGINLLRKLL